MIRSLLFLTIVLSLASATLAYLTKEKASEKVAELTSKDQTLGVLRTENSKLRKDKEAVAGKVEELSRDTQQQQVALDKLKKESSIKEEEVSKVQSDLQMAQTKVTELQNEIAKKPETPLVPNVDPAAEQVAANLRIELEKMRQALSEEQAKAEREKAELKAKVAQMVPKPAVPESAKGAGAKEPPKGQVVAYNEGWNFVVVNLGDKQGVTPESKLEVQRGGKVLAKLEITEVKPKFFTAGLTYGEGARAKVRVQPGDAVVFAAKAQEDVEGDSGGLNASELFPSRKLVR